MDTGLLRRLRLAASLLAKERANSRNASVDCRDLLLRKKLIHELSHGDGAAPDGLSDAYLALAAALNAKARRLRAAEGETSAWPLTAALTELAHEEVAAALLIERRLLHLTGA
jgi:hypothetical protein